MVLTRPAGLSYRRAVCLGSTLALACATSHSDFSARLRAGRPTCLAFAWREPVPAVLGQPAPDTLILEAATPADWTWPQPSGPVRFLPSRADVPASLWMWSLAGDSVRVRTLTPTEDDVFIRVPPKSNSATWSRMTGPTHSVDVRRCKAGPATAAT
jgi:hypothetical protein